MTDPTKTRGARKLAAAIGSFVLAPRIAGAKAIDVGASTGGFSAILLEHGARAVTAIDVGRGQLADALREDPRVHWHEQTDFRRAPLAFEPGPFDFFTVDVSFMAARNVLRPLAFRLRQGAEGIVLLKPQFELPKALVHAGDVSDPKLRARALERFSERARELGFRLEGQRDSSVAGGSGTVEIFLHLRFEGRTSKLPQPGEHRGASAKSQPGAKRAKAAPSKPPPAAALDDRLHWFAVAAPGLEGVLAQELRALPQLADVSESVGGVSFAGTLEAGYAANLRSRVATRVLLRLGEVEAREFAQLRRRLARLPFERFLSPRRALRIDASAHRCRLYHTGALRENLLHAASDRLGARLVLQAGAASDTEQNGEDERNDDNAADLPFGRESFARVLIRGDADRFSVSVDSSGLLLHRRGARVETGRAPLRETLASGILLLAGYDATQPLVNAMCGAGTIALEAAGIALGRAGGHARGFAMESFPCFEGDLGRAARAHAAPAEPAQPPAAIYAFDRDARAVESARRNLERADAAAYVQLACTDIRDAVPPAGTGLFIANPPYGRRLSHAREVGELYRVLGDRLRHFWRGWRIALLVPRETSKRAFGLKRAQDFPLVNGGIRVKLLVAQL